MSCSGRPPAFAHSWCKVLSHRGAKGQVTRSSYTRYHGPVLILLLNSGFKLLLTTIRCFNYEIQLTQLSHSHRLDTFQHSPLLLLFGVIRPYFYTVGRVYVRVSAVPLQVFAFRRSTDCKSSFLSFPFFITPQSSAHYSQQ